MADVFVSYSKKNRAGAEKIVAALGAEGFSVWWDDRLEPAESWDEEIEREIAGARAVVVLWTKESVKSRWVRSEAQYGLDKGKLAPASLEACDLPIAFLYVQAANLARWEGDRADQNWKRFTAHVRDVVAGQAAAPRAADTVFDVHGQPDWRAGYGRHVNGEPILRGNTITATTPPGAVFRDDEALPLMTIIGAGRFVMGSPANTPGARDNETPARTVQIARPFALGIYPVTFDEWARARSEGGVRHDPKDEGWGRGARPVIHVSWNDAGEFAAWLSARTGERYRLPSEAEWEYACRAGAEGAYSFAGAIEPRRANYAAKSTQPVGGYEPNRFGLYDMHGNVREWVEDLWHDTYADAPTDALPWLNSHSPMRVVRGGGWLDPDWFLRSASRGRAGAGDRCNFIGLRVARDIAA
jgi:formylglycine-generating enzyme required for sulfatase activity